MLTIVLKPLLDTVSERGRDVRLDAGSVWTLLSFLLLVAWLVGKRRAMPETWILVVAIVGLVTLALVHAATSTGTAALLEGARVAAGLAPAVVLLDATRHLAVRRALARYGPLAVATIGLHIVVAWLQFFGLVSTTYQQAGSGRPSGLFFHPVTLGYVLVALLLVLAIVHGRRILPPWVAIGAAAVVLATILVSTHRTSILAAGVVLVAWVLVGVLRGRTVRPRGLAISTFAALVLLGVGAATSTLWSPVAQRIAIDATSVLGSGDLDPTSERFLRGRGERWATAIDALNDGGPFERLAGYGFQVVDPHSDFLRVPLVHGWLGSGLLLVALTALMMAGSRRGDVLGRFWVATALVVALVFAVTTKPTSYPSFMWAWTLVLALAATTRRDAAKGDS